MEKKVLAFLVVNIIFNSECWCGASEAGLSSEAPETVTPYPGCGVRQNDNIQFLTGANSYPWIASVHKLNLDEGSMGSMCSATLIHPRFLITAAHCVSSGTIDDTLVVLGTEPTEKLKDFDWNFLSKIHFHPKFNQTTLAEFKNNPDVALLELEKKIEFGKTLNAICLPSVPTDLNENMMMEVAGFDHLEHKAQLNTVRVLSNEACGYTFLKSFHVCTTELSCNGWDIQRHPLIGGGPLVMRDEKNEYRYTMTAVNSFGKIRNAVCGEAPFGYTRLTSEVLEWVKTTAGMV